MNAKDVVNNLTELMMNADNEKDFETLSAAVRLLAASGTNWVSVPCRLGDIIYSVIGEKVNSYVITGFRIDEEEIYMETQEGMFLRAGNIGMYYFFSRELAEREFNKKWRMKH